MNQRMASRTVHRRAHPALTGAGHHDFALEVASEAAPNYLKWIAELCAPYLGDSVLDLGAGHGAVTQHLADGRRVVALDASDACVAAMNRRFDGWPNVRVVKGDLRDLPVSETFDSIVMINVLEHIYDDAGTVASLHRCLNPGGSVILYVPAFNWLYSSWDRKVGHFRRYTKTRIAQVVAEGGLQAEHVQYVNLLAIPAWLLFSVVMKFDESGSGSLRAWDRVGTPVSKWLESRVSIPIGLNLLCVARRLRSLPG